MAVFGKRGGGSGVFDAPEDTYAQSEWTTPEPAPAGMLQRGRLDRGRLDEEAGYAASQDTEDVYKPKRESMRYKLRLGVPKSLAGRIVGSTMILVVLCVALGAVLAVRAMLMHDSRFAIATSSEIQIEGNKHLTREQVLSVFGADLERNIFKVPLAQRRADLERLPWVEHATVMRLLPNTVRVAVSERTPVAFVRQGTQIGLVDAAGVLLDMPQDVAGDPKYSFPVLTGLAESDPLSVRAARMEVYRKFMAELDGGTGAGSEKPSTGISEVDVSNPEDVKALIASGSTDILVHFGDEDFLNRYKMFEQNLPQWKAQYPKLASVDTRYDHQFVLEMQGGTPVPLSSSEATIPAAVPAAEVPASPKVVKPIVVVKAPATHAVKKPAKVSAKASAKVVAKRPAAKSAASKASKQKIAAMLAAARKKPASHGVKP
jgi:cell division protein FtsQ